MSEERKPRNAQLGDEGANIEAQDIHAWQFAWARLIAKAWEDPALQDRILSSAEEVKKELEALGYYPPGNITIKVEKAPDGQEWQKDKVDESGCKANGYVDMLDDLSGTLIMVLPPAPKDPIDYAYALSDYGATGKDYPLSL